MYKKNGVHLFELTLSDLEEEYNKMGNHKGE
ncbi:MAG TPA: Fur-regulated basic protein FbpA [Bacillus sp. (in: firmicutes)]|nr:Fur-regulated basic protein FbpA [Bacillus sp. (in: firmicutes)]